MKILRYWIVATCMLGAGWVFAEPFGNIGFEMYSWQDGSTWSYSVLEGTATTRSLEAIRGPKNRLKNLTFVKGRLAALPEGEIVYWRVDKARGLRLPPKEIVHELNEYARTAQIKLLLPGQVPSSKANEEIHSDIDQITE